MNTNEKDWNMNLLDIVHRLPVPAPWSEGDKIPRTMLISVPGCWANTFPRLTMLQAAGSR